MTGEGLPWNGLKAFPSNHWSSKHVFTALHSNSIATGGAHSPSTDSHSLQTTAVRGRQVWHKWAPRETNKALEKPLVAIARQSLLCYYSKEALTSTQTSGARLHKRDKFGTVGAKGNTQSSREASGSNCPPITALLLLQRSPHFNSNLRSTASQERGIVAGAVCLSEKRRQDVATMPRLAPRL
jgi:hypothetical protein